MISRAICHRSQLTHFPFFQKVHFSIPHTMSSPTQDEIEEFILSCRYGELEEVQQFSDKFGWEAVIRAKDDRGNTGLHMCCANGHVGEV
jgi:ankyrin repeat protein